MQIETHIAREQVPYGVVHAAREVRVGPKICLDIDGVLANFVQSFCDLANKKGYDKWPICWQDATVWIADEDLEEVWSEFRYDKNWWLDVPPMEDAHHLHFRPSAYITARSVHSSITLEWLTKWGFPLAPVYTLDTTRPFGTPQSKVPILRKIGATHMVEDRAEAAIEINQAGILCYLLNRPWNINVVVPDYVPRIVSLKDIIL